MLVISSAMLNDLVGWIGFAVVLALLPATMTGDGGAGHGVALTIGLTLAFLAVMLTLGRWFFHRSMPWVQAHWSWPGGMLAVVFVGAMVCAAFTEWLGIHSIFGAFVAGVAIGDSYHLTERTRDTIHQFVTNIFAPIFFASIGLRVDFVEAFDLLTVGAVLSVAITGKLLGSFLGAKLGGKTSTRESWAVAFGMTCQGAVGIILGQLAYDAGLITERLLVAIVIMALITSLMSGPGDPEDPPHPQQAPPHRHAHRPARRDAPQADHRRGHHRRALPTRRRLTGIEPDHIREPVAQREKLMHTGLPGGLAVPHARLPD